MPDVFDQSAAEKILTADISNIVRKVKAGKPLSADERKTIEISTAKAAPRAAGTGPPANAVTLSAEQLCALTGYTDRRHRQLAKEGRFPAPYRGHYQADATRDGLIKYFLERLNLKSDAEKILKVQQAEVKLEIARAELATAQALTIPKKTIGPALRNIALHQRSLLQRKLESELAPKISGLRPLEIRAAMVCAVDEICAAFADGVSGWLGDDRIPAKPKPNPKPMPKAP